MAGEKSDPESAPLIPKPRQRNVTVLQLVAITYFAVAGGPEGTETLIQTGGPLYAVIGFFVIGILWSIPMALMAAELTTAFPENGGYVLWVTSAFGQQAGEMAGWLQFVSSGVDACIYPGLFLVYLKEIVDTEDRALSDPVVEWTIKVAFVAMMLLLNILGIESVGHGSTVFMIMLLSPFVVIILIAFTGVFTGTTVLGWPFSVSSMLGTPDKNWTADWSGFFMVLLWNMGYWEGASVCAGEVADVGRVFPMAMWISLLVVLLNYILPIMAFAGLDGNYAAFDNGHYISVARDVCGPYFAYALGLAQTVSVCGLFANGIIKNTYMVCGMSEQGLLPKALGERLSYTQAPYVALSLTVVIMILIMPLGSFKIILGVDIDLYCIALLLEIAAFLYLRYSQPNRPRDFRVPVDGAWLWLMYLPMVVITVLGIAMGGFVEIMVSLSFVTAGILVILALHLIRTHRPQWFEVASGVVGVVSAEGGDKP